MEVISVAINICKDEEQGLRLWPLDTEAGLAKAAYDYLVGESEVATVMVREPIERLTSRENDCMTAAVMAVLKASGAELDGQNILYAGPTSQTIIDIARRLAE